MANGIYPVTYPAVMTVPAFSHAPLTGVGGVVLPVGSFKSLTIRDDTGIDIQSGIGANGSGWVANVVLAGITSLVGTLDASKLSIVVSDPGFDASGNATTVQRTITGMTHVRRQYPNGASKMISTDNTDLTVLIALSDYVYSGTTIVSATLASGFYTGSLAGDVVTKTNNSVEAYPKPVFSWINLQQDSAITDSHDVEAVVFHRHAQQGRQVACIKFRAGDGTNNSAEVTTADTALSALVTVGNVPEVWKATLDFSGLTQAAMCTVNAVIYPWIGTSFSLATDGWAWPTTLPGTPLRVLCDRTGGYGGGFAYVLNGAVGGTASGAAVTARLTPYPTIALARAGLQSWRNTNKSLNNLGGGTIRLMDNAGADQTHTMAGAIGGTAGDTWLNIEPDPLNTGIVTVEASSNSQAPHLTRWRGNAATLQIGKGAAQYTLLGPNSDRSMVALENLTFSAATTNAWFDHWYLKDIEAQGGTTMVAGLPRTATIVCSAIGVDCSTQSISNLETANVLIGVKGRKAVGGARLGTFDTTAARGDGQHERILYNCEGWSAVVNNASARAVSKGYAAVQNLFEMDNTSSNNIALNLFADGDLTTIDNLVEMHNTMAGDRGSRMYNDRASTKVAPHGVEKKGVTQFCIFHDYNNKADTFTVPSPGSGSVGAWAYRYSVGNHGNVSLLGGVAEEASAAPTNNNDDNYLGNWWQSDSEYNLFRTALGFTKAQIRAMFTNYTVDCGGNVPAMGGDYHPLASATHLKSRVPAGKSVLKYDLAGDLRKTDGTGAAGAYEAVP